jgi:hypothetical protein
VWGTYEGLGGTGPFAIVARACCSGHVRWVFRGFGDGGEGLSGWLVRNVLVGGLR